MIKVGDLVEVVFDVEKTGWSKIWLGVAKVVSSEEKKEVAIYHLQGGVHCTFPKKNLRKLPEVDQLAYILTGEVPCLK